MVSTGNNNPALSTDELSHERDGGAVENRGEKLEAENVAGTCTLWRATHQRWYVLVLTSGPGRLTLRVIIPKDVVISEELKKK
jgi:hypothetical protein